MVPMKVTVSYLYYELYNQKTSITSIAELIELKDSRIATADLGNPGAGENFSPNPMSQAMRGWLQTQAIAEHYNAP